MWEKFNKLEYFILNHIKFSVIFIYNILMAIMLMIYWHLIPFLLSYPPNFNEVSNKTGTSTLIQYIIVLTTTITISILVFNKALRGIDEWSKLSIENENDLEKIIKIRRNCMDLPYKIFWNQIILFNIPVVSLMMLIPTFLTKTSIVISLKVVMVCVSLTSVVSVVLYAVYRKIFKAILLKTYIGINNEGIRVGVKKIIFIQIIPLLTVTMIIISLVGYSRVIDEKDEDIYTIYNLQAKTSMDNYGPFEDSNEVMNLLKQINYSDTKPIYFVKKNNDRVITSDNSNLSVYLSYYIDNPYNTDRIFDLDSSKQGIVMKIPTKKDGVVKAGIIFNVVSDNLIIYYLVSIFILLFVNIFALYYVSKTLSDDISEVAGRLMEIAENEELEKDKRISVTSNDEIGDLVIAFNKIRERQFEYDKLKSEFISNISHELRTPINVIFTAVQLFEVFAKDGTMEKSENSSKNLKIIKQNCLRLIRLINNLIDTTKIDAGYIKLHLQSFNIVSLVREIIISIGEYARSKNINLEIYTEMDEKIVRFDIDKIETIILNLLSNAIKFTKRGGNISVNLYDKGDNIMISVKDTGIGIPKDKQNIIFERFRQAEQSLVKSYEGSGIGLSLVKSFVEMHGGKIYVKSEEGVGSEFIIELPVKEFEEEEHLKTDFDYSSGNNSIDKINIEFSDIYLYK